MSLLHTAQAAARALACGEMLLVPLRLHVVHILGGSAASASELHACCCRELLAALCLCPVCTSSARLAQARTHVQPPVAARC